MLAFRQWRKRHELADDATQPAWMTSIVALPPSRAFLLGVLLSGVDPKNLTLAIGAALVIAQASLDLPSTALGVIVFIVLGSISIIVPVVYALVSGESARHTLDGWKSWLNAHNTPVMCCSSSWVSCSSARGSHRSSGDRAPRFDMRKPGRTLDPVPE